MTRLSRILSQVALFISVLGLIAMVAIICWQVFARYVLSDTPAWAEQMALFTMVWFILFAAAVGVREDFHIRLSLAHDLASPKAAKRLKLFCHLIVLLFGIATVHGGLELVVATWQHVIPTLGIPRGTAYLPIAGAGALIVFFAFEHCVQTLRGKEVERLWN